VKILFQGLVGSLCLSISFGVITGGKVKFHVQGMSQRSEEM
jgi:hypothetical protein